MIHQKKFDAQMNLPLCRTAPIDLPVDKQRELAAALADLLWTAAVEIQQTFAATPTGDEA